jgi:hypothetical protein
MMIILFLQIQYNFGFKFFKHKTEKKMQKQESEKKFHHEDKAKISLDDINIPVRNDDTGVIFDVSKMSLTDTYRLDTYLHDIIETRKNEKKVNLEKKVNFDSKVSNKHSREVENNISQLDLINRVDPK